MTRQITIRYFEGCPNWRVALERAREAVDRADVHGVEVGFERVETAEEAERVGFRGSPTVLIDGRDPFADRDASPGLSCRVFATELGPQGSPSVVQLREALQRLTDCSETNDSSVETHSREEV